MNQSEPAQSKPKNTIGILGGMGPEATALLMSRIIKHTVAEDDSDHIPLLIDNNTQVPSRIKALIEKNGEDPGPVLQKMAHRLETMGASALAMPCNTAHYYAPIIQQATHIPFLNMIDLSVENVAQQTDVSQVGMLGSPAIQNLGLFDRAFARKNIKTFYPQDQLLILEAIQAIKSGREDEARPILAQAALEMQDSGTEMVMVACSEFSIISDSIPDTMGMIDTIDVLTEAIVTFASTGVIKDP